MRATMASMVAIGMVVLTAVLLASAGCSSVAPDAGQEAVLVRKPMFIGHGGVDPEPIRTGLKYVAWTTSAVYVGMTPKQQEVAFDDLFTADGVPLDFHTAVQYRVTDSVKLVSKFGADDGPHGMGFFVRNLQQPYGQIVRDSVKKHGLNEMAINASAAEEVDGEVTARFKALVQQLDVPIEVIGISLGRANPPDAIKHQRIATAEQEQRINTERQRKLAEDIRRDAEASRAIADNAYRQAMQLSPDQFLGLERIKMLHEVCAGGKCQFIENSGAIPTLPVR